MMMMMDMVVLPGVPLLGSVALFGHRLGQQQSVSAAATATSQTGTGRPAALPALRHVEPTGQRYRLRPR